MISVDVGSSEVGSRGLQEFSVLIGGGEGVLESSFVVSKFDSLSTGGKGSECEAGSHD